MTEAVLGSQTYATYVDVDTQVIPWLKFGGLNPSDTTRFILELITDSVCAEAQRFIGGPIALTRYQPTTGIGTFDGSGGLNSGFIMLPRFPVVEIMSVVEYQGNQGVTLSEVKPTGTTPSTGFQCNYRTGRLTRVLGGIWNRPFYPGSNNIWVTWAAGYNPIPADIVRATVEWIAYVYRNTQQSRGGSVRGSAAGEYDPATINSMLWAGIPNRVADTLKSYWIPGIR